MSHNEVLTMPSPYWFLEAMSLLWPQSLTKEGVLSTELPPPVGILTGLNGNLASLCFHFDAWRYQTSFWEHFGKLEREFSMTWVFFCMTWVLLHVNFFLLNKWSTLELFQIIRVFLTDVCHSNPKYNLFGCWVRGFGLLRHISLSLLSFHHSAKAGPLEMNQKFLLLWQIFFK